MSRALVAGLGLALLAGVLPVAAQEAPGSRIPPARADSDLARIRNIFRFADEPARVPAGVAEDLGEADSVGPSLDEAAAPVAPRLIGLVRRHDILAAALAIDGEVLLLSEGQAAGGFTVTDITEEGVRLRGPGGEESALRLP